MGLPILGGNTARPGSCGVVYKLDSSGNETVLLGYAGYPYAGVIRDAAGHLYGTGESVAGSF